MFFGVLICLNSFLFVFTFLPLRLIYGLFQVLCRIVSWKKCVKNIRYHCCFQSTIIFGRNSMLGSHKCDLARGVLNDDTCHVAVTIVRMLQFCYHTLCPLIYLLLH